MISILLPKDIEYRLKCLAKKTFYVREEVIEHLEDVKDAHIAMERLADQSAKRWAQAGVDKKLGLYD